MGREMPASFGRAEREEPVQPILRPEMYMPVQVVPDEASLRLIGERVQRVVEEAVRQGFERAYRELGGEPERLEDGVAAGSAAGGGR